MDDKWDYAGGIGICGFLHPNNEAKRAECIAARAAKNATKNLDEQADLILAQAAADKADNPSTSWTAGQTVMVVGGSILALTVMIVIIKKVSGKGKAK